MTQPASISHYGDVSRAPRIATRESLRIPEHRSLSQVINEYFVGSKGIVSATLHKICG